MEASISEIQNEMSSLGKRVAELEEHNDVENLKGELRDVRVELSNVRDKLDILANRVSGTQVETAKLETSLTSQMAELKTDMTSQMAELKTDLTDRMTKLETDLTDRMTKLETDLTDRMTKFETNMTDRMTKLETNMASQMAELEARMTSKMHTMFIATITVLGGLIVILQFFD